LKELDIYLACRQSQSGFIWPETKVFQAMLLLGRKMRPIDQNSILKQRTRWVCPTVTP
jgi:hypothetical protein